MNVKNMAIIGAVVVAAAAIVLLKQTKKDASAAKDAAQVEAASQAKGMQPQAKALPRLVDLGAGKCIPCKAMKPILEELASNHAGSFKTEFIDVWENPDAGKQYGINLIPTQIFYGADGKELFRHEGFFSKEDILGKWKELGVETAEKNAQRTTHNAQR
ncbi:MAG: thioredoxin family protein [Kiritimatiellia bacterium]|jgi:thioredoxin 1|nr:thioredoxin family protein [Kiritimatiellia bacterium]